jgi:hypothetical protein
MIRSLIVTPQSTTWYTQGGRKMKLITALFAIMILVVGCGPHFLGKPEPYVAPASATPPAVAPAPAEQNVTLKLPNWPMVAYAKTPDEAFVLLIVKDPKSFPIPREITFNKADGTTIVMPMLQPDRK